MFLCCRTAHDFLIRHLRVLPFQITPADTSHGNLLLSAQSWLLRAVAVELRLTSLSRQRSHTQRLLSLLLEDSSTAQNKGEARHNTLVFGAQGACAS